MIAGFSQFAVLCCLSLEAISNVVWDTTTSEIVLCADYASVHIDARHGLNMTGQNPEHELSLNCLIISNLYTAVSKVSLPMSEILLLFAKVPRGLNHNPTERSAFADLASSESTWWDCEPESKSSLDEVGAQYSSTAETVSENLEFLFDEGLSFFSDLSEQSQELSNENLLSAYNLTGPPSTLALNGSAANEVDVFVKATFPLIQPGNGKRDPTRPQPPLVKEPSRFSLATTNSQMPTRGQKWPTDIPVTISTRPTLNSQPSRPILRERPSILQKLTSKLKRSERR